MGKKMIPIMLCDANSFALNTKPALVMLEIAKEQIVAGNIASAMEKLHILTDSDVTFRKYKDSLVLMVEGYDNDRRELVEIPEVRAFFNKLNQEWPHWLWFANKDMGSLVLLFAILCEVKIKRGNGQYSTEFTKPWQVTSAIQDMLYRGEALFATYNIAEEEITEQMDRVAEALSF